MKTTVLQKSIFGIIAIITIISTGCKNPLINTIEEEVEYAVTHPEIEQVYPADTAENVAVNTNTITITFSKQVDPSTVNNNTILVRDETDTQEVGSFSVSGETITFNPSGELEYGMTYVITVTKGVKDTDGNPLSSTFSWSFTTGLEPDTEGPTIESISINEDADWSTSLTLSIAITARDNYDTEEQTAITQAQVNGGDWVPYAPILEYTIQPGEGERTVSLVLKDGAGNISLEQSTLINIDTRAPLVENFLINGGRPSTNELEISLYVIAAEPDGTGSGVYQYRYRNTLEEWPTEWSNLTSGSVSINGEPLPPSAVNNDIYTYECVVTDYAGNESVITAQTIRYDLSPPVVLSVSPEDGETNIPYNTSVVSVIFDDSIDFSSLNAESLKVMRMGTPLSGKVKLADNNEIDSSELRLTELTLQPNTDYIVTLSSEIRDAAGNEYGVPTNWYFQTGDALDTSPPTAVIQPDLTEDQWAILPNGTTAVNQQTFDIEIDAEDDYNSVYGLLFWGDSDGLGSIPVFESGADWEEYSTDPYYKTWPIEASDGLYVLLYRLMDSAGNISASPHQYKVLLDTTPPLLSNYSILNAAYSGGSYYNNDPQGYINLQLVVNDLSGVEEIMYSNASDFSNPGDVYEPWSPLREQWQIDTSGNGAKDVYVSMIDYLGAVSTDSIPLIWDTTPPAVSTDPLFTNTAAAPQIMANDIYGIASYDWETGSSPAGSNVTISDNTAAEPTISADTEGEYILILTVTDVAGNETNTAVPFVWDLTPPEDMGSLTTDGTYSTTNRPVLSWAAVNGADYYSVSINSGPANIEESTTFTPDANLPEGTVSFTVTPMDNAGNSGASSVASITVDTLAPEFTLNIPGALLISEAATLDFTGPQGSVTDNGGTGFNTIEWTQTAAPSGADIGFGNPSSLSTSIAPSADGNYQAKLTVTDIAGNSGSTTITVIYDTTPPLSPVVTGIERTPVLRPTWTWNSGGNGGSGTYSYRLVTDENGTITTHDSGTTTDSFYTPGFDLDADPSADNDDENGLYTYILYVSEVDAAGNPSEEGAHGIWVDSTFTAPPEITVVGPTLRNSNSISWNWTTGGAAGANTPEFRYAVQKNNETVDLGTITWTSSGTEATLDYTGDSVSGDWENGDDDTYTIVVQEYDFAETSWGKANSHTVRVDRRGPLAPTASNINTSPTVDTTPAWTWSSNAGADGTGIFQVQIDSGAWSQTSSNSYKAPIALSSGPHSFSVQEQDALGNWGTIETVQVTVDTTPPNFTALSINNGDEYTNTTEGAVIALTVSYEPDMKMSLWNNSINDWGPWIAFSESVTVNLPAGSDGPRYVKARVKDALGNVYKDPATGYFYRSDSIRLDTTPPKNVQVTINRGDSTTPSLNSRLSVSATDYAALEDCDIIYYVNNGTGYLERGIAPYSDNLLANTNFTISEGTKYVGVRVRDPAGNLSDMATDSITLQIPSPIYATKGAYTRDREMRIHYSTTLYYNSVNEPTGSHTTSYSFYWTTDPDADPNKDDKSVTLLGSTTNTSSAVIDPIPAGEVGYIFIRAFNSDSGNWGPYSLSSSMAFSSLFTIIYNEESEEDIKRAQSIKAILEDVLFEKRSIVDAETIIYEYNGGVMPEMKATMLPQSLVNLKKADPRYTIFGDPVIITTESALLTHTEEVKEGVLNVISGGNGVISMGNSNIFIKLITEAFDEWGLIGQRPEEIINGIVLPERTQTTLSLPYSTSDGIWYTPYYNKQLREKFEEETKEVPIFTEAVSRYGVRPDNPVITEGDIYTRDPKEPDWAPVIRQGRFMIFGFYEVPRNSTGDDTREEFGIPFFLNLVDKMFKDY